MLVNAEIHEADLEHDDHYPDFHWTQHDGYFFWRPMLWLHLCCAAMLFSSHLLCWSWLHVKIGFRARLDRKFVIYNRYVKQTVTVPVSYTHLTLPTKA